jgi:hypothetical protein
MDDSIDDVYGISFHRVILESEDIYLGYADGPVNHHLGTTDLSFWDYGTLLPDLIFDTANYRYGIVRIGWQYLDMNHALLLYWSNPVSQVLRAMAFKRTTRGRSNFGELMTAKIS